MNKTGETPYIGYEYKTVTVSNEMEHFWIDNMKHFGWEFGKKDPAMIKHVWGPIRLMIAPLSLIPGSPCGKWIVDRESKKKSVLTFKRDKKLPSKDQISNLEISFEQNASKIETLDASKTTGATVAAYTIGLIGTVFLGAATFAYLYGLLSLCIILAIPGFICWVLPFFVKHVMAARKSAVVQPQIEKVYEDIDQICRKANAIMQANKETD